MSQYDFQSFGLSHLTHRSRLHLQFQWINRSDIGGTTRSEGACLRPTEQAHYKLASLNQLHRPMHDAPRIHADPMKKFNSRSDDHKITIPMKKHESLPCEIASIGEALVLLVLAHLWRCALAGRLGELSWKHVAQCQRGSDSQISKKKQRRKLEELLGFANMT
jgi:hypothetical protein